tara:strand:- start:938 stop:1261 length:324 start_codon:yes stop_codon:yes gene_type:complete
VRDSKLSKSIKIVNTEIEIAADEQLSVLENLKANKIPINNSCEGMGTCTTCRVFVHSDLSLLKGPNEVEAEAIAGRNFAQNERLSCQLEFEGSLEIEIPSTKLLADT